MESLTKQRLPRLEAGAQFPFAFVRFVAEVSELPGDKLYLCDLVDFDDDDGRLLYMLRARADEYAAYKLPHPVSNSLLRRLRELLDRYRTTDQGTGEM